MTISIRSESDKWRLSNLGFRALGPAAAPAIPELEKLLESPRHSLRAVSTLQQIGAPAVDALVSALTNKDSEVRRNAALALMLLEGEERIKAVPKIVRRLDDADLRIRIQCAAALGRWNSQPQLAVPALVARLDDPDPLVRSTVIQSLADFGPNARAAVPELLVMLKTEEQQATLKNMIRPDIEGALRKIDPVALRDASMK